MTIDPGCCGGAVINSSGEVVGLLCGETSGNQCIAVPYNRFYPDLGRFVAGQDPLNFFHNVTEVKVNKNNFSDYFDLDINYQLKTSFSIYQVDVTGSFRIRDDLPCQKYIIHRDLGHSVNITFDFISNFKYNSGYFKTYTEQEYSRRDYHYVFDLDELIQGKSIDTYISTAVSSNSSDLISYDFYYNVDTEGLTISLID